MRIILSLMALVLSLIGNSFLMPDEAFKPTISKIDDKTIAIDIELGDKIYLYADKLSVIDADESDEIIFNSVVVPEAVEIDDEMLYESSPRVIVNLAKNSDISSVKNIGVTVAYQGCSSAGLCYEPIKQTLNIDIDSSKLDIATKKLVAKATETVVDDIAMSETDKIASVIEGGSLWFIILSFFGFGLLLALTPCVFPMIPIISSVIVSQGGTETKKAFWMSVVYVLSMAVAYTIAGVLAGLFGANLQAALQTPWIITLFALVFIVLAMSMFDLFELQIPNSLQSKITQISGQKSGMIGVAIMGFLSALIVGPCVAAPLAGALIYIGQTGDALLGGVALFALSIGMGIPLIAVGTSAGKFMPRPGAWMDVVKSIFGVMLLGVSIWMISRVIDENISMMMWGGLAVFVAINIGALEPIKDGCMRCAAANRKALGIIVLLYGMSLLLGGMSGAKDPLHPLDPFLPNKSEVVSINSTQHNSFEKIRSLEELEAILSENSGKKILVDFYADWCSACKELESKTFSNSDVKDEMDRFVLVKVDLTANDDASKAISSRFGIFGPPAILFFDESGERQKALDIVGFKPPLEFIEHLKGIK